AYVRTLPSRDRGAMAAAGGRGANQASSRLPVDSAPRQVLTMLDQALGAARAGRSDDAGDRAFDAYIAFEPLETSARAKSPGLVAGMERHFADFKGAVKRGDLRVADAERNAIEAGLPGVVALTQSSAGGWGAFFQSFLIIFREGLEAILVIGAVVTFLIKTGNRERLRSIWAGVAAGLAASAATAVVLRTILAAVPASSEIIEGVTLLVAVAVLFSVSYWLISKVEAAKWQQFIKEKVGNALAHGGGTTLAFVAFLAVYREGAETALFYQALFAEGPGAGVPISLGILAGFAVLGVVFTLFYRYGVRLPLRPFFAVTSALLYYMALVFVGKGVRELQEGNVVSITALPGFPHADALGLFPSVETLLAQLVLLVLLGFALVKTFWPKRAVTLPTMPPPSPPRLNPLAPDVVERLALLQQRLDELTAKVKELEAERAVGASERH
ncbi:MAG TPA: FTR1 family protein, partial [Gemmatimonadaceae bacterium]|nr:FTR1 family protein [Gemmatimonadaceae bacterium]